MEEKTRHRSYYIICADKAGSNRFVETVWHDSPQKQVRLCEEDPERYKLERQWLKRTGYRVRE